MIHPSIFCFILSVVHPFDSLVAKSYRPPIADSLRSGILTVEMEEKTLYKNKRRNNTQQYFFSQPDSSRQFVYLKKAQNNNIGSMTICDRDHIYFINGRDSSIIENEENSNNLRTVFKDNYFSKWLTLGKEKKEIMYSGMLQDTIIKGIPVVYFCIKKENFAVGIANKIDSVTS